MIMVLNQLLTTYWSIHILVLLSTLLREAYSSSKLQLTWRPTTGQPAKNKRLYLSKEDYK